MVEPLVIAQSKSDIALLPALANRHGLIAGATGTATGRSATLITGQGSQTSYDVMSALSTLFNSAPGCDLTARPTVSKSYVKRRRT